MPRVFALCLALCSCAFIGEASADWGSLGDAGAQGGGTGPADGGGSQAGGGPAGGGGTGGGSAGGSPASGGGRVGAGGGATTGGGAGGGAAGGAQDAGQVATPPMGCADAGTCPAGTWLSVTPSNLELVAGLSCGNYGVQSLALDPHRRSDVYVQANCQGVWKSEDYGRTWKGPINTGLNGATFGDCAGGIASPPRPSTSPPVLYGACIRGAGMGFWRSTNGGVDWVRTTVGAVSGREDYYAPAVDPWDERHLLMAGHEMDVLVESTNGGEAWSTVTLAPGMLQHGGTAFVTFIDTGDASTTRGTWLYMGQASGGAVGTWRTTDSGQSWTRVEKNEKGHGATQIYQPDTSGVIFMAGLYSDLGWGVLRSDDFGAHWTHVGATGTLQIPFGTSKRVYAMWGWAAGQGVGVDPSLESGLNPGLTGWAAMTTPPAMYQGPGGVAVTSDGHSNVILTANYNAGLWFYLEP